TVEFAVPLMLLPITALLLAVAILRRRQVLAIWREGQPVHGVVIDIRQSAIAPLSRLVRYSIIENNDNRVFSTLIPAGFGIPDAGEMISLLALPMAPNRAIVTELYE